MQQGSVVTSSRQSTRTFLEELKKKKKTPAWPSLDQGLSRGYQILWNNLIVKPPWSVNLCFSELALLQGSVQRLAKYVEPHCTIDGSSQYSTNMVWNGNFEDSVPWQRSIQQEKCSFHQQIGRKFKEETSTVLHLDHSFICCRNLNTAENSSGIPGKF